MRYYNVHRVKLGHSWDQHERTPVFQIHAANERQAKELANADLTRSGRGFSAGFNLAYTRVFPARYDSEGRHVQYEPGTKTPSNPHGYYGELY